LAEKGVQRAGKAWDWNRYLGPCPVTLQQYTSTLRRK
jgi:hypothetical protein